MLRGQETKDSKLSCIERTIFYGRADTGEEALCNIRNEVETNCREEYIGEEEVCLIYRTKHTRSIGAITPVSKYRNSLADSM